MSPSGSKYPPLLDDHVGAIKAYRDQHKVGIKTARQEAAKSACAAFEKITSFPETNFEAIYHHRRLLWGSPCEACGQLLCTPRATFCASCGVSAPTSSSGH